MLYRATCRVGIESVPHLPQAHARSVIRLAPRHYQNQQSQQDSHFASGNFNFAGYRLQTFLNDSGCSLLKIAQLWSY